MPSSDNWIAAFVRVTRELRLGRSARALAHRTAVFDLTASGEAKSLRDFSAYSS
jgi:hypothetical protein